MSLRWTFFIIGIITTSGSVELRSAWGEVRGFHQLAHAAKASGGIFTVMAFQKTPESQHLQPRDTSPFFRLWFKSDINSTSLPKPISEIWFDWTIDGNLPAVAPKQGPILVLRSSTHPALVQKLATLLMASTSCPIHPAFILSKKHEKPEEDMSNLIDQCIALGEHLNGRALQVGMIDCLDSARIVNQYDFYIVARAGEEFLLLSQSGQLHLEYCEPVGVQLSAFHFNLLSDSIRISSRVDNSRGEVWHPNVIGREGFQLADARGGRVRLYHRNRIRSHDVTPTNTLRHCQWVRDCRPKDVERLERIRNSVLLTGLAVCSPAAWREEHRLPIDPELLIFGGDW